MTTQTPPPAHTPSKRRAVRAMLLRASTDNFSLKLLSLVFAVGIWAWVQSEQVVERRARATVHYRWPDNLVRIEDVPKTLVVSVSGPQGLVRTLDHRKLNLLVDLSDADEGPVSVDFSERAVVGLPQGLEAVKLSPPGVNFRLDKAMTRTVRVRAAVIGDPSEGWKKEAVTVEPQLVEITGPQTLVRNISEVSTDIVDISGARKTRVTRVPLAIKERTVSAVDDSPFTVTVDVQPVVGERVFAEVPVLSRASGWRADPPMARVTLSGPVRALGELKTEKINLVVHLPSTVPVDEPVQVLWDPSAADQLVEVVHQGPPDVITVTAVDPVDIVLEPEE